jgi:hypothetical protein
MAAPFFVLNLLVAATTEHVAEDAFHRSAERSDAWVCSNPDTLFRRKPVIARFARNPGRMRPGLHNRGNQQG